MVSFLAEGIGEPAAIRAIDVWRVVGGAPEENGAPTETVSQH
jgi:hypothetical protein